MPVIAGLPYRRHVGLRRTPVNISEFNTVPLECTPDIHNAQVSLIGIL